MLPKSKPAATVTHEQLIELWRQHRQIDRNLDRRGKQTAEAMLQATFKQAIKQASDSGPRASEMLMALNGLTYAGSNNRICPPSNQAELNRALAMAAKTERRAQRNLAKEAPELQAAEAMA